MQVSGGFSQPCAQCHLVQQETNTFAWGEITNRVVCLFVHMRQKISAEQKKVWSYTSLKQYYGWYLTCRRDISELLVCLVYSCDRWDVFLTLSNLSLLLWSCYESNLFLIVESKVHINMDEFCSFNCSHASFWDGKMIPLYVLCQWDWARNLKFDTSQR